MALAFIDKLKKSFGTFIPHNAPIGEVAIAKWTPRHWAVAISLGSFFAISNFIQNTAIIGGFHDAFLFIVALIAFLAAYNILALILRFSWLAPPTFRRKSKLNAAAVLWHLCLILGGGAAILFTIAMLTSFVRMPGDWRAAFSVFFPEIVSSCTPIWVFLYVTGFILLRYLPAKAPQKQEQSGAGLEIHDAGATTQIPFNAIKLIEAQGNYVRIETADGAYEPRISMTKLFETLPQSIFIRTHRSIIVEKSAINRLRRTKSGAYKAEMQNGRLIPVSRNRVGDIRAILRET